MRRTIFAVFDLDGTLIDSRRDLAESANEMLAGYGAPPLPEDDIAAMIGCGAATLVKRVLAAGGIDVPVAQGLERFLSAYDGRLTQHTRLYDGVQAVLDELHRGGEVNLALLTNKPLAQTVKILEQFDIARYFQWVVGGDGPWPRKPAPDGMWHLMQQASAAAGETVLIGDSVIDLQTSRNAGVPVCLARYGFGFTDLPADALRGDESFVDAPLDIADVVYARR